MLDFTCVVMIQWFSPATPSAQDLLGRLELYDGNPRSKVLGIGDKLGTLGALSLLFLLLLLFRLSIIFGLVHHKDKGFLGSHMRHFR